MLKAKFISIFTFITVLSGLAQTPSFAWAKQLGGTVSENFRGIAVDNSGNSYNTGSFTGTVDLDPGPGTLTFNAIGSQDMYVCKLDNNGNLSWAKQLGGVGPDFSNSIAIDQNGNCYITGMFSNTVDFDPGPGTYTLASVGGYDIFICKLDVNGNFVWAKALSGADPADQGQSIAVDASGNVYTTGAFGPTVDFDPGVGTFNLSPSGNADAFISKLDASGNFVWAKSWGSANPSTGDFGQKIVLDNLANVYVLGYFTQTVDFDPGGGVFSMSAGGAGDVSVSKFTSAGNFVYAKQLGNSNNDFPLDMCVDATGNAFVAGYFANTLDLDPGAGVFTLTAIGSNDTYIDKLDASGNFVWGKRFGGAGGNVIASAITLDATGNVLSGGNFNALTDFDPGVGTMTLNTLGGGDAYISKLDPNGNYIWAGAFGSTGADNVAGIASNSSSAIYVGGSIAGSVDMDAGAGVYSITTAGSSDVYISKYLPCSLPDQPVSISGSTAVCSGSAVVLYSVAPVGGAGSYTWNLPAGWSGSSTTNTISANAGTLGGTISVVAGNTCGISPSQTIGVSVLALPSVTASSTSSLLCIGNSATLSASGASTYVWNPGGNGASIVVTPTTTTQYTIMATDANGCSSNTVFTQNVTDCSTGLKNNTAPAAIIHVYPNPFDSKLVIKTTQEQVSQTFSIVNVMGEKVFEGEINNEITEIDLDQLSVGIYYIRCGSFTGKMIKTER